MHVTASVVPGRLLYVECEALDIGKYKISWEAPPFVIEASRQCVGQSATQAVIDYMEGGTKKRILAKASPCILEGYWAMIFEPYLGFHNYLFNCLLNSLFQASLYCISAEIKRYKSFN